MLNPVELAKLIDHTNLKPMATGQEIGILCREALAYEFASVCIHPCYVSFAVNLLDNSPVQVCTVVGFPLGANTSSAKAWEAAEAVKSGAAEVDMVINVGALKGGQSNLVRQDIQGVVEAARAANDQAMVKVILETCFLNSEEIKAACLLAKEAGANFVKTSTGFGSGGATVENVILMRETVGESMGIKAAGGVRTYQEVLDMLAAGANRIGTSSGIDIVENYIVATGQYPVVSNQYR